MTSTSWFLLAAAVLALERVFYVWAWRGTASFRAFCRRPPVSRLGEPVQVLERFFYLFKALQIAVFATWVAVHATGSLWPADRGPLPCAVGATLVAAGQVLNAAVFRRLGRTGVFYGSKLGYDVPWCEAFPFSILAHPQYVGAVLTIWGIFVALRFPADDWWPLPLLETAYYALGARLESDRPTRLGATASR